ncbi:MAG: methionine gamma-lyase family protein [Tissierellia bacterium]|nr:methionine gamma-lyase family protein [Tissierellia bacterium]
MEYLNNFLKSNYKIDEEHIKFVNEVKTDLYNRFEELQDIRQYNTLKVLKAMQDEYLGATDFNWTTGYGYGDIGRDKTERIYANIFNTEDALVRPTIASGTHAINLCLSGLLKSGDHLLEISGTPYDTLLEVIGLEGDIEGTLIGNGVEYGEVDLIDDDFDYENILKSIKSNTKLIAIQRSTGYSDRKALSIDKIKKIITTIKKKYHDIPIFIDNCYGEFTDYFEPSDFGADIMAGSLIKNPGGGLAYSGGYIVGKKDLIHRVAKRLTAPGIEKECGLTFGQTRTILQGLSIAPMIVNQALKGAILIGEVYKRLGFKIVPDTFDKRSDIILGIEFKNPKYLIAFCRAMQEAAAVDSYVVPEAWEMPGYEDKVIMASGSFIDGSSIEISADGPMRDPFFAYYQGGLTFEQCILACLISLRNLKSIGAI